MKAKPTSQFVAVKGTRENSHPSCEGRSEVSRMYLFPHQHASFPRDNNTAYWSARTMVFPPKSNHRLCISESR
jgi:hypothetical protein